MGLCQCVKRKKIKLNVPEADPKPRNIPRIDTTPEELAKAIFRNADRDLQTSRKIKLKK